MRSVLTVPLHVLGQYSSLIEFNSEKTKIFAFHMQKEILNSLHSQHQHEHICLKFDEKCNCFLGAISVTANCVHRGERGHVRDGHHAADQPEIPDRRLLQGPALLFHGLELVRRPALHALGLAKRRIRTALRPGRPIFHSFWLNDRTTFSNLHSRHNFPSYPCQLSNTSPINSQSFWIRNDLPERSILIFHFAKIS